MDRTPVARLILLAFAAIFVAGCSSTPKPDPVPVQRPIERGAPPSYASVAEAYNARVRRLEKLRTPVTLRVLAPDAEGNPINESAEGNLSIERPSNVALRIDKVGQTLFHLGSNDAAYWWMDLSGDEPLAFVGRHALARPATVRRFGVPVHPLDLVELLAITPLPAPGTEPATVNWSTDGRRLAVMTRNRWGLRRIWLDPVTLDPVGVDLLDNVAQLVAMSRLREMTAVDVRGEALTPTRVAADVEIELPVQRTTVRLRLAQPENPGDRMRPEVFNLERLGDRFGVRRVVDMDAPATPPQANPASTRPSQSERAAP